MLKSQSLLLEQSEKREKINSLLGKDTLTDAERVELESLTVRAQAIETEYRAAVWVEDLDLESRKLEDGDADAEQRERLELRGKASLGLYLVAALRGRAVTGAELELQEAAGVDGIPLELWDSRVAEHRDITPAPGTVGVNLDPIAPAVFAPSIADRLMIEMPQVQSGTYATATISTSLTADAKAKSAAVPQTEGALTVGSTTPHRVGASLALTLEDIAAVGAANFEAVLRENVSLALSAELDDQIINGDDTNDDLIGILERLTNPPVPAADVETWVRFLAIQSGGIDGLWATELAHIAIVCNPETYRLSAATFQGSDAEDSAAMYLARHGAEFWTNSRMPPRKTTSRKAFSVGKADPECARSVPDVGIDLD